jgi:hypothetical protein
MTYLPSKDVKDLLVEIIDRYMTTYRFTTIEGARTRLRDKLDTFEQLTKLEILTRVEHARYGTSMVGYYPRMLAFEYVADDKRKRFALRIVNALLKCFKNEVLRSGRLAVEISHTQLAKIPEDNFGAQLLVTDFTELIDGIESIEAEFSQDTILTPAGEVDGLRVTCHPAIRDYEDPAVAWANELKKRVIPPVPPTRLHSRPETKAQVGCTQPNTQLFCFMKDQTLRSIAARDYREIVALRELGMVKTRFILIGGVAEALLLDLLLPQSATALTTTAGQKEKRNLEEWGLGSLIDAAVELNLISRSAQAFGHSVREFRNLVHPGLEKRSSLSIDTEELEIAEKILSIIVRDLMKLTAGTAGKTV